MDGGRKTEVAAQVLKPRGQGGWEREGWREGGDNISMGAVQRPVCYQESRRY